MAFVFSQEEMDQIHVHLGKLNFRMNNLIQNFKTDPEFVRGVIPPIFEPDPEGNATLAISFWGYNGRPSESETPFYCASVDVGVSHNGESGTYNLAMFLDDEPGTQLGRQFLGESKKLADIRMTEGDRCEATVTRNGVVIAELSGEFDAPAEGYEGSGVSWEIAGDYDSQLRGLRGQPYLHVMRSNDRGGTVRRGRGTMHLRSTLVDSLGDIPILEIGSLDHYLVEESIWWADEQIQLEEDPEVLARYLYARNFDLASLVASKEELTTFQRRQPLPPSKY